MGYLSRFVEILLAAKNSRPKKHLIAGCGTGIIPA